MNFNLTSYKEESNTTGKMLKENLSNYAMDVNTHDKDQDIGFKSEGTKVAGNNNTINPYKNFRTNMFPQRNKNLRPIQ